MKNQPKHFLIFAVLAVAGCGESGHMSDMTQMKQMGVAAEYAPAAPALASQRERNPYLAYEHNVTIEVDEDELQASFLSTVKKCIDDVANACEIHYSDLTSGDYPSAQIRVRIKKEGVEGLIQTASEHNEITSRNVSAEDLATPIMDNEKRLRMLESYQKKLIELESRSAKDIESLIKISSEIAKTQSDLEAAKGENEYLMKRVNLDIVSINFVTDEADSFLKPIGDALENFVYNLSKGIAGAITVVAFVIPWVAVLIGLFFLWRRLWPGRKRG
ncbi:MAG TPA: DUF4349 domain-containing protein [Gammaproteobacteria bacterium]|nr:DUF4349 domain-containing protein [Gammaproteobacteria bacterium]